MDIMYFQVTDYIEFCSVILMFDRVEYYLLINTSVQSSNIKYFTGNLYKLIDTYVRTYYIGIYVGNCGVWYFVNQNAIYTWTPGTYTRILLSDRTGISNLYFSKHASYEMFKQCTTFCNMCKVHEINNFRMPLWN